MTPASAYKIRLFPKFIFILFLFFILAFGCNEMKSPFLFAVARRGRGCSYLHTGANINIVTKEATRRPGGLASLLSGRNFICSWLDTALHKLFTFSHFFCCCLYDSEERHLPALIWLPCRCPGWSCLLASSVYLGSPQGGGPFVFPLTSISPDPGVTVAS